MTATLIRLDDLAEPVLTDDQRRMLEDAERSPVELSVDAVLREARRLARLDGFGPDDFRDRLAAILAEVDEDENATGWVRRSVFNGAVRHAVNRLRLLDLLRRHPEIREVEIERPIVIAGLPRSGTTHLLNLLAADRRLESLPYWLAIEPIPDRADDGDGPRLARARRRWEQLQRANPTIAAYHPMPPDHIHEDIELQMPDFSTYIWEWWARVPRWRDRYLATDQAPHYAFGRTMLQAIAWQRGARGRWVLKAPQHVEQLPAIMRTYPDATVVFTHRDPVASLQSIVTQHAYRARLRDRRIDLGWYLDYWTDRVRRLLDAYVRDRDVVPAAQRVDVPFDAFMADDVATAERILDAAGLEVDDASRAQLRAFMDEHPRGRHGRIDHDLRRDFGADPDELWDGFASYTELLGLAREVR